MLRGARVNHHPEIAVGCLPRSNNAGQREHTHRHASTTHAQRVYPIDWLAPKEGLFDGTGDTGCGVGEAMKLGVSAQSNVRIVLLIVSLLAGSSIRAQELEPRAYSPNPVGINFILTSYGQSIGGVLFDASLPFSDVDAHLDNVMLGYGRAFDVFGRSTTVLLAVPYVWGDISGNVGEDRREISRSGLADTRFKLSINLLGGPALSPAEFAARKPDTTLGASLSIVAPTGEYDPSKLINIGSNRWAFKPELGVSHPIGPWFLEASAGVWLFTSNDDFYGGRKREQDPISALQLHASYTFRPRLWLAANATYYEGGRTTVDGQRRADLQANLRVGLTLALPLGRQQTIKLAWSEGASTRIGGDFTTYSIAWQYLWF